MTTEQKPRRVRRKSIALQLQALLDSAQSLDKEPTNELSIARMKFLQARIAVLTKMQSRENNDKLKQALEEVAVLRAENIRLREQLSVQANRPRFRDAEVDEALERYERSKNVQTDNES